MPACLVTSVKVPLPLLRYRACFSGVDGMVKRRGSGVDQQNIHQAIVVVVKDGYSGSCCFWKIARSGVSIFMDPGDPGFARQSLPKQVGTLTAG